MIGELLQRAEGLFADLASEHGVHLRLGGTASGSSTSQTGSSIGALFLGRSPAGDLLLADDVGVVLRDLHVLRHVGQ